MTTAATDAEAGAAARSAATSLGWNYAGSAVAVLIQLGYTAYSGRTVTPNDFGAYAIALTVTQFLGYFANAGLSTCLLRAEQMTADVVRAARRVAFASGAVCFVLIESIAPLCETLWHMPHLTSLLRVLGCQFIVQPAAVVGTASLRRIGRARAAVTAESAGLAAGVAVGALLLAHGWNPLGLAAMQPATAAVSFVFGAVLLARRPLAAGRPARARDLLLPSGFLAGYSLVQFTTNSIPMWTAGRLISPAAAGAYSRAALMTGIPLTLMAQGLNLAAAPALAERRGRGQALGRTVEHTLCMASAAAFIGFGALAGIGSTALDLLLGPGWEKAAELVPVLAVGSAMALLSSCGSSIDQVRRAPRALLATQLAVVAGTAAASTAAVVLHNLFLLAGSVAAGQTAGHLVQLVIWHRAGLLRAGTAARTYLPHASVGAALAAAGALGSMTRPTAPALVYGLASILPVVVVCTMARAAIPVYATAAALGLARLPGRSRATAPLTAQTPSEVNGLAGPEG